ncbi:MAG: GNAT family N-acetyltransferase [Tabrizicola sp.]
MASCEEFAGFLPLQQSAPYAAALEGCGARVRWAETDSGPVLMVERGRLRLISRIRLPGRDADMAQQRHALRRLARWPGLTVVTPETGVRGFGLLPLVTPMHHAIWALGPDLRARMARTWRDHLAGAERAGLAVRRGGRATLDALIRAEAVQRAERRYRALPEAFTRALPAADLRLWEWRQGGEVQAAMCFVVHGASASYHLSWGSGLARKAGVHGLMLTRAAEALREEGVRWLDLGSVDTERAPGLARFKLGTGARLHRLGATALVLP